MCEELIEVYFGFKKSKSHWRARPLELNIYVLWRSSCLKTMTQIDMVTNAQIVATRYFCFGSPLRSW